MFTCDSTRCIGCGRCVAVCPMGYIGMNEGNPSPKERRRCIRCMHCVSTCPKQAIHFTQTPTGGDYRSAPEGELERIVVSRRSVRKFREEPPKREDLQWAFDCAEYAPSGKNMHEHHWTIVYGRPQTKALTEKMLDVCRKTGFAPELPKLYEKGVDLISCGAPCMILGWSPDDALNPVLDAAVALTTIDLLLVSRGYGTCWGGYLRDLANEDASLSELLGVPEGNRVRCALVVGYPAEQYPNIPYRPSAQMNWVDEISG